MKQKINLTLNDQLIVKTKKYVRKQGLSVSQFIEHLLTQAIDDKDSSFTKKWQGKLKAKVVSKDDPRLEKLQKRYS